MEEHKKYIKRALELAQKGGGFVAPNPKVGAVIVSQGKIIGEGYHAKYGQKHAEVAAIEAVIDKTQLKNSTLYVTLEPCSHHGQTPPCADLIIESQIPKVVAALSDSNPKVNGEGFKKLQNAGIEVITGILANEARSINQRFFTFWEQERPYIILKWAQTIDGFMDINLPHTALRQNYWISNEEMKIRVHQWRAEESAIMVGMNTLQNDNPALTARYGNLKNPIRITIDTKNTLSNMSLQKYRFFDNNQTAIVFHFGEEKQVKNTYFYTLNQQENIVNQVVNKLYQLKITSLLVEGGNAVLKLFLETDLWDEMRVIEGNKCFGSGLKAPDLRPYKASIETVGDNKLLIFKNI
ncbi:MAG: bifunctional diaminohydroxyphosphoribosylaminopyrimidine deaminase/5-amino-6-(5-phosphoribosylamino)uracil reductase RibD [Bacteroidales bacterium]|jgi:diaminohydroxyphosphoribosylaminopyrimidine deaminase/5-amino-6-(5-phosphoribosylamino)uracil reductase|nr:bifunctional diaminohydroxyphosphoribosylaminopyrimidine deaminase/5-amino-6-(5-phosphoribosylamino)uracil reductase RibD [Bacteroidales bacterium]